MVEIRPIPGYPGYGVTEAGQVWSYARSRWISLSTNDKGYKHFSPVLPCGRRTSLRVNIAVALAFIPNPLGLPEVNHIDGVKSNNHRSNLEWQTVQGNNNHALVTGLKPKNTSSYYGVSYDTHSKGRKHWQARVGLGNRSTKRLGRFLTEIEAAYAYNDYITTHGLDRPLNQLG